MQWEYKVVQSPMHSPENLERTLNVEGEMNWETVGISVSGNHAVVILKREKASKSN
jgi:hypothetical protein